MVKKINRFYEDSSRIDRMRKLQQTKQDKVKSERQEKIDILEIIDKNQKKYFDRVREMMETGEEAYKTGLISELKNKTRYYENYNLGMVLDRYDGIGIMGIEGTQKTLGIYFSSSKGISLHNLAPIPIKRLIEDEEWVDKFYEVYRDAYGEFVKNIDKFEQDFYDYIDDLIYSNQD